MLWALALLAILGVLWHRTYLALRARAPSSLSSGFLWSYPLAVLAAMGAYAGFWFWLAGLVGLLVLLALGGREPREIGRTVLVAATGSAGIYFLFARVLGFLGPFLEGFFSTDQTRGAAVGAGVLSLALLYSFLRLLDPWAGPLSLSIKLALGSGLVIIGAGAIFLLAQGREALPLAARDGHPLLVRALLLARFDGERPGRYAGPPLVEAALSGQEEAVKVLLAAGANPKAVNRYGQSALRLAAGQGHAGIVRRLLAAGAKADEADAGGWTPLMQAAYLGGLKENAEVARILLQAGAKIDAANAEGETALMIAAREGAEQVLEILLEKGARRDVKNKKGKTALNIARARGRSRMVLQIPQDGR